MRLKTLSTLFVILAGILLAVPPVAAQSPHNSAMVVIVSDPSGMPVPGAGVTVTNAATGAARRATTGQDGSATFAALPLTGGYKVTVALSGFETREVAGLSLRDGEKAAVRVTLEVEGKKSDVTVYGTAEGVRADAQIGRRLDASEIEETP
ncbi:MAG TPA: carboxypeptidase-like regulatory domain-containing protein, partial [Thermoanaerobaculia bacterium]|nr:carboxypeptidase-like regulatory domain-containing protein [Thermoanaerobaculia bacterium]